LSKRQILGSVPVYSFFPYSDIEPLILSKHTDQGHYLFSIMAKRSFGKFSQEWHYDFPVASIGIDDFPHKTFSHTALLNRSLKSPLIHPYFGKLRAQNRYRYAGKTLEERINHPRHFEYSGFEEEEVILVDDIITTGTTLVEAAECMHQKGKRVILALTLADAAL